MDVILFRIVLDSKLSVRYGNGKMMFRRFLKSRAIKYYAVAYVFL